ncbi:MAG: PKD repeat protein [Sphingobacteriales bacterium]|jgi:PKD repeat protein
MHSFLNNHITIKKYSFFKSKNYLRFFIIFLATLSYENTIAQLTAWTDKQAIEIKEQSSKAKTDFPVLLILDTQTPIAEGKMQSNGNDIRFATDCEGNNTINYWIENHLDTDTSEIWLSIPELPANSTDTIYWFYGNPAASSLSAFDSIFKTSLIFETDTTVTDTLWDDYDWIEIKNGIKVRVISTSGKLSIKTRKIVINGTLDGNGSDIIGGQEVNTGGGYAGGLPNNDGSGPGGGKTPTGKGVYGGGGAGYGGKGGQGGGSSSSSVGAGEGTYGSIALIAIEPGSGGGGSGAYQEVGLAFLGGNGGAAFSIEASVINVKGMISVNGGGGIGDDAVGSSSSGSGGGSGGGILLKSNKIDLATGILRANGGGGGNSDDAGGGGGGGGRIKVFYDANFAKNAFTTIQINGGNYGNGGAPQAINGELGTYFESDSYVSGEPTLKILNIAPSISISISNTTICSGAIATFTATPQNAGASPTYQWKINGGDVFGETGETFSTTLLNDQEVISCNITSSNSCAFPDTAISNEIIITITNSLLPEIAIFSDKDTICKGENVNFTSTIKDGGSNPSYQWKINHIDIVGKTGSSFSTNILKDKDTITCELTSNDVCAVPKTVISDTIIITVIDSVFPEVSITTDTNEVCEGTEVLFTSSESGGGLSPTFKWKINGLILPGEINNSLIINTLENGNQISLDVVSSAHCAFPPIITSNIITMIVHQEVTPSIDISTDTTKICKGDEIVFNTIVNSEGDNPKYQWYRNGTFIENATANTYTTDSLSDKDNISCILISDAVCAVPDTVISNTIVMTVFDTLTPQLTISVMETTICVGTEVTFTAHPSGATSDSSYQWKLNGSNIIGATDSTYSTTSLGNNNTVTCEFSTMAPCANPKIALSNTIVMEVVNTLTPSVSITVGTTEICEGENILFSANPVFGGNNPAYQWRLYGSNILGETGNTYSTSDLSDGDEISLEMTSNNPCADPKTVLSDTLTITVNPLLTPEVSIIADTTVICEGEMVNFSVNNSSYEGNNPEYQWLLNGSDINGETANTLAIDTLTNAGEIILRMTSYETCADPQEVSSNSIFITVNPLVTPEISIVANTMEICVDEPVNFGINQRVNEGESPLYQWKLNGNFITDETFSTYSSTMLNDSNEINLEMTSDEVCANPSTIVSNTITLKVNSSVTPQLTISSDIAKICEGDSINFRLNSQLNQGTNPSYQWQLNDVDLPRENDTTYSARNLMDDDKLSCLLTSDEVCANPKFAKSNIIAISVNKLPVTSFTTNPQDSAKMLQTISFENTSTGATSWKWDFGDGSTSTDFEPSHQYPQSGNYTVVLIADNEGCLDTSGKQLLIKDTVSGIVPFSQSNLLVYPNPNNGIFVIESIEDPNFHIQKIEIYNQTGKLIHRIQKNQPKEIKVDISDYTSGLYTLVIRLDKQIIVKKIAVSN